MHKPLFFVSIAITILLFSLLFQVYATTTYKYNSCEDTIDWTSTLTDMDIDYSDYKEGYGSINFVQVITGVQSAYLNNSISNSWGNDYEYTTYGCWLKIVSTSYVGNFLPIYWYDNVTDYYMIFWLNLGTYAYWQMTFNNGSNHIYQSSVSPDSDWHWYEIQHRNSTGQYKYYIDGNNIWTYTSSDLINVTQFRTETVNSYAWDWKLDYIRSSNIEGYPPTSYGDIVYSHTFIPSPEKEDQTGIILNQSTSYLYIENITVDSLSNYNGTFYLYTTGAMPIIQWILGGYDDFGSPTTGNIINGNFSFQLLPRSYIPATAILYETIKIETVLNVSNVAINNTEGYDIMYQLPTGEPFFPIPTNYDMSANLISWLVIFLIVFVPVMILGLIFKKTGLLIGMIYSVGIGVITSLVPTWFIVVIVVGMALVGYDMLKSSGG